ncbi:hypothetical protein [Spiroplasma tabanidicola]|uniref:Uncharacterized protein n=1 Tax=Spiroplasma tabanidicola TaxID=324079 RepID=A0A6I6CB45_9MOLU|nr:hypothetical protein [Spiroplasma tabanidicola]QGS52151.1 hypothetical protein STABA_v1c07950 [Spiroplasma tabanidicola]
MRKYEINHFLSSLEQSFVLSLLSLKNNFFNDFLVCKNINGKTIKTAAKRAIKFIMLK